MQVFKSKAGYELLIPITVFFVGMIVWVIIDGAPMAAILTVGSILLITYAFVLYTFLGTTYTVADDGYLYIKSGFMKYQPVNIGTIITITKTQNPISSPAPSLDRIEVFYGKFKSVVISPKDKLGLVKALKEVNPKISYHPK
ncbi:MAG: PH domain-containing protein [Bacteroidota bacterium]